MDRLVMVAVAVALLAISGCGGLSDECDKVGTSWCEGDTTIVSCAVDKVAFRAMLLRGRCPAGKHCVESPDGKLAECL